MSLDGQEVEVEELREEVEKLRETVAGLQAGNDALRQQLKAVKRLLIGDGHASDRETMQEIREEHGPINAQLAEVEVEALRSDVRDDILREVGELRAQHGADIRKLAEETGTELLSPTDGDLITQVREEGVEGVTDPTFAKHRRAEIVLRNIEEWGEARRRPAGIAYRIDRPRARRLLSSRLDSDLQSKQVAEVFDAIVTLAERAGRYVEREKEEHVEALYVGIAETEAVEE